MRNNKSEACKICRKLSEDEVSQCEYKNMSVHEPYENLGNSCLSKDRAMIVLLHQILETIE